MSLPIIGFDPTAVNVDNFMTGETHVISSATSKVLVADYGTFYTKAFVAVHVPTGNVLTLGTQYKFRGLDPDMTALTGKEVAAAIEITDLSLVGDVTLDYHAVGGHEGINSYLVKELIDAISAVNASTLNWNTIANKPLTYNPDPHVHNVITDLTGLNSLRDSVLALNSALTDNRVLVNSSKALNDRIDRLLAIIAEQRKDINALSLLSLDIATIKTHIGI